MGDALAVLDPAGSPRTIVLGCDVIGSQLALLLSATFVERASAVVIVNGAAYVGDSAGFVRYIPGTDSPATAATWLASDESFDAFAPSWAGGEVHREMCGRSCRRSAHRPS